MPTGGGTALLRVINPGQELSDVQDNTANELKTQPNFDAVIHTGLAWAIVEIACKETQSGPYKFKPSDK